MIKLVIKISLSMLPWVFCLIIFMYRVRGGFASLQVIQNVLFVIVLIRDVQLQGSCLQLLYVAALFLCHIYQIILILLCP